MQPLYDLAQVVLAAFVAFLIIRDMMKSGAPKQPTADSKSKGLLRGLLSSFIARLKSLPPARYMRGELYLDLLDSIREGGALLREPAHELPPLPVVPDMPLCFTEGGCFWLSLDQGHWGIFGASGSGKGNTLQLIALSLLRAGPGAVELVILDPKAGLDYAWADRIDHAGLWAADHLSTGYRYCLAEMSRRNQELRSKGYRNIREYNLKHLRSPLPYMVIIADEVADLGKEDKQRLATLARMGRAAGLVLFVCTQYPTAEALSTQVQANLLNRLVLRLSSKRHTEVALSRGYGERGELEPAEFDRPGLAVLKTDGGREQLAQVPELTESRRDELLAGLMQDYLDLSQSSYEPSQDAPVSSQEPFSGPLAPNPYPSTHNPFAPVIQDREQVYSSSNLLIERLNLSPAAQAGLRAPSVDSIPAPACSKCGLGPEAGEMRLTPRGGKHIHRACYGGKK